jgi:hypothetical protein
MKNILENVIINSSIKILLNSIVQYFKNKTLLTDIK